jgi:hypothetical protein
MEPGLVEKLASIESKHAAGKVGSAAIEVIRRQLDERRRVRETSSIGARWQI